MLIFLSIYFAALFGFIALSVISREIVGRYMMARHFRKTIKEEST